MGGRPQQDLGGSIDALRRNEDERGILGSQAYFHQLIAQEVEAGIPADRVVLGGFSQGGAMAVFAGLTAPSRLAGVVGLSCYLLLSLKFRDLVPAGQHNHATPVLVAHGSMDPVIPFGAGQLSYDMLKAMGYNVTMKVYE
jgi:lysophospholipase-1